MTNEELDVARAKKAAEIWDPSNGTLATTAARLAREGWMPPVPVDPDIAEAERLAYAWHVNEIKDVYGLALAGIKRGRALAAEAKPGMVWVKRGGSTICPVDRDAWVLTKSFGHEPCVNRGKRVAWQSVTHYAVITPPEDVA